MEIYRLAIQIVIVNLFVSQMIKFIVFLFFLFIIIVLITILSGATFPPKLCICVVPETLLPHRGRWFLTFDISKEIVKECFGVICLINLALKFLQLEFQFAIGTLFLILFCLRLVDFDKCFVVICTEVVYNVSEVLFEVSKLTFDPSLKDLSINYWIVKVKRLSAILAH